MRESPGRGESPTLLGSTGPPTCGSQLAAQIPSSSRRAARDTRSGAGAQSWLWVEEERFPAEEGGA